jgi:hypothetical protein
MRYRNKILLRREREEILLSICNEKELSTNFTLNSEEIKEIQELPKPYHRIGYALQLLYLRVKGLDIRHLPEKIPGVVVNFIEDQLGCTAKNLGEHWRIKNTKSRYFYQIIEEYSYSEFKYTDNIREEFYKIAFSYGDNVAIVKEAFKVLKDKKIVPPSLQIMEHLLWLEIKESDDKIFQEIRSNVEDPFRLYSLLDIEASGTSIYSRIKNISVNANSGGAKALLKMIKELDIYRSPLDLSFLSEAKVRYFNLEVQKSDKHRIDQFSDENKKLAYLAMFIHFRRKEFVDMVIEVTSAYTQTVLKRSRKKSKIYNLKNQEQLKMNTLKLKEVVKEVLELNGVQELRELQESLLPLNEELESQRDELEEIDFLLKSQSSFNYTNELIEIIEFESNTKPEFIRNLKEFPALKHKKKIDMDISIFNNQWQKNIKKMGSSKKSIELALLYSIRDYIRSGDIFVKESKKYNSFDHYLVEDKKVPDAKEVRIFLETLKNLLVIPRQIEFNTDIQADDKSIFSDRVYNYFPKISMPEILYEVNTWTGVFDYIRDSDDIYEKQKHLIAALMSNGHNIGFSKMAISSSINETLLRRIDEFYFNSEALSKAQKILVNYHHSLDIVKNWGEGYKSSSDGMRVPIA